MNITELEIDGFGVWSGLRLDDLTPEINVFYGPNEAGKTTLMQFVRAVLYGFSPARRQRYLPPVHGGQPGGSLSVQATGGTYRISRFDDGSTQDLGQVTVKADDGSIHGGEVLSALLGHVDESIFTNVFAVGLRELQELGTLSDTQAARQLYELTAGLERVSLPEVLRELEFSRDRLFTPVGGPSQIADLLALRGKLRGEVRELSGQSDLYWRVAGERDQLQQQIQTLEQEAGELQSRSQLLAAAIGIRAKWDRRAAFERQIAALGAISEVPAGGVSRLDDLKARRRKCRRRWTRAVQQRKRLRAESAEIAVNEPLWRHGARIVALAENDQWLQNQSEQAQQLSREIAQLEPRLAAEAKKYGLPGVITGPLEALTARGMATLRSAALALRKAKKRLQEAKQEISGNRQSVEEVHREIETALAGRKDRDLTAALEEKGQLVSQLRRRVQLDERLQQMARTQDSLELEGDSSVDRQMLPGWIIGGLGALFVLGVMLTLAGVGDMVYSSLFASRLGWLFALIGVLFAVGAIVGKWFLEQAAAREIDDSHKQLATLRLQMVQAKEERASLDEHLPRGGGPLVSRLQKAEQELAELEDLLPLEAKRQTAQQQASTDKQRMRQAAADIKAAREKWQQALSAAGLPGDWTPKQVKALATHGATVGELHRRLDELRGQRDQRQRELAAVAARTSQLLLDCGLSPQADDPRGQIRQLRRALEEQESLILARDKLRRRGRRLKRYQVKQRAVLAKLARQRRALLQSAGAPSEQDFRRRATEWEHRQLLELERDTLTQEIEAALAGQYSLDALQAHLNAASEETFGLRSELTRQLDARRTRLHKLFEQRGELKAQLKAIIDDRRLPLKRLELAAVGQRLAEAAERWQVLAITGQLLAELKREYEQERQPQTLQNASVLLSRLTEGRYTRIWTRLGESVLLVDDAQGTTLPVEVLSRGTREQLFLSLRLALAASFSESGIVLPLVLDDVLVNFDVHRAKAAAGVLRDFAAEGHQLLLFTCHEHIMKIFRSLRAEVRRLPANSDMNQPAIAYEPAAKKRPRRAAAESEEIEPVVVQMHPEPEEEFTAEAEPLLEPLSVMDELPIAAEIPQPVIKLPEPIADAIIEPVVAVVKPAAPSPPKVAKALLRAQWDAEEFEGELQDRVYRRIDSRNNQSASRVHFLGKPPAAAASIEVNDVQPISTEAAEVQIAMNDGRPLGNEGEIHDQSQATIPMGFRVTGFGS